MELFIEQGVHFILYFLKIFFELMFYSILLWVIFSWLILFGIMRPTNSFYMLFSQIVSPILKPFRWARIGMLDFSPIAAILVLHLINDIFFQILARYIGG